MYYLPKAFGGNASKFKQMDFDIADTHTWLSKTNASSLLI